MGVVADSLPGQMPVGDPACSSGWASCGARAPSRSGHAVRPDGGRRTGRAVRNGGQPGRVPAARRRPCARWDSWSSMTSSSRRRRSWRTSCMPAVSWAEADGTFTNLERRATCTLGHPGDRRRTARLADHGRCWPNAGRRSRPRRPSRHTTPDWKRKRTRVAKSGPVAKPWTYGSSQAVLEEISKAVPMYAGMRWGNPHRPGPAMAGQRIVRSPRRFEPRVRPGRGCAGRGPVPACEQPCSGTATS